MSFFENWNSGCGFLVWPLWGLALIALMFFVERFFFLHRGRIHPTEFLQGIRNLLGKERLVEALTICEETPGPIVRIVKVALLNHQIPPPKLQEILYSTALLEIPLLERRVPVLLTLAKIVPLLGLMGTLLALLRGFRMLNAVGTYANVAVFSEFVGQALTISILSLAIAVICHLGYHFLYGRVRTIIYDMEWTINELLLLLSRPEK